jgi:hypothetical protein
VLPDRTAREARWSWGMTDPGTGHVVLVRSACVLVLVGLVRGPRGGWFGGLVPRCVRGCGVGAQHVGQGGPHGQDQYRQAGYDRGDGPRCLRRAGLGQQVIGDLPGHPEREGEDRGPFGEPAGAAADRVLGGQPGTQRVRGVGLDADGEGDASVQVQGGPDPGRGETSPNPVFCAMPTQPDQTSAAAGAARTSSGQDRTVLPGRTAAGDRSATAGPVVVAGTGPRRPGPVAGSAPTVSAAMPVTTLPS